MRRTWFASALWLAAGCPAKDDGADLPNELTDSALTPAELGETATLPSCPVGAFPACDDSDEDVYAFTTENAKDVCPGTVVACSSHLDGVDVSLLSPFVNPELTLTSGSTFQRIAYRTERAPGVPGIGSAMILHPTVPDPDPNAPVVVVAHGTVGLADVCAPSLELGGDPFTLAPLVGSGLTVIAVDYAGLGTESVQGYGDPYDTAHSVLDGARAVLSALGQPDRPVILAGHSQGGGAALNAQALATSYAPDLNIIRVLSWAGGVVEDGITVELDPSVVGLVPLLPIEDPLGTIRAVLALSFYADFALTFGEERAGEVFHPDVRDTIVEAVETRCIFDLATYLNTPSASYQPPATVAELVDPTLMDGIINCVLGDPSGCTPTAEAFVERLESRATPPTDPAGAPVLYVSGAADTIHLPQVFACNVAELESSGVSYEACLENGLDHFTVIYGTMDQVLPWMEGDAFVCEVPAVPPPCF